MADLMLLAPAHLCEARIYDRLGNKSAAGEHYRQFLALWHDADPEFNPVLDNAKRALIDVERK